MIIDKYQINSLEELRQIVLTNKAQDSVLAERASVEASLKRLSTDYIDLYWTHCWIH